MQQTTTEHYTFCCLAAQCIQNSAKTQVHKHAYITIMDREVHSLLLKASKVGKVWIRVWIASASCCSFLNSVRSGTDVYNSLSNKSHGSWKLDMLQDWIPLPSGYSGLLTMSSNILSCWHSQFFFPVWQQYNSFCLHTFSIRDNTIIIAPFWHHNN